ncbi:MAG: hypothetical protein AB1696_19945 [Planctomycetota bacterium]
MSAIDRYGNPIYGNLMNDLGAYSEIKPQDGEVRKMTLTVSGEAGWEGDVFFYSDSLSNGMDSGYTPLITVWFYDDGEGAWKVVSTNTLLPQGVVAKQVPSRHVKIPVGQTQIELEFYVEARSVPDFWTTGKDETKNYFEAGVIEQIRAEIRSGGQVMGNAAARFTVVDMKHYYLQSTHTYGNEPWWGWTGHSAMYFWGRGLKPEATEETDLYDLGNYQLYDHVYEYPYSRIIYHDTTVGRETAGFDVQRFHTYTEWRRLERQKANDIYRCAVKDPDAYRATARAFRLDFSHSNVQALLVTAITYKEMKPKFEFRPDSAHDNCSSSISGIYDKHANLVDPGGINTLRRGLRFPPQTQTYDITSARNWGKFAVGSADEGNGNGLQPGNTWLQNRGWVVAANQQRLITF